MASYSNCSELLIDFRIPYNISKDYLSGQGGYIFEDARGNRSVISHQNMMDIHIYHNKYKCDHNNNPQIVIYLNGNNYYDVHSFNQVKMPLDYNPMKEFKVKDELNLKLLLI